MSERVSRDWHGAVGYVIEPNEVEKEIGTLCRMAGGAPTYLY